MVSRSIGGSESGPLPTSPGHMALCNAGYRFLLVSDMATACGELEIARLFFALDQLNIERDSHFVGHCHSTGLQNFIPNDAVILAADFGGGVKADLLPALRVFDSLRGTIHIEHNLASGRVDGEVAGNLQFCRSRPSAPSSI